ncbi:MAG: hypothetical protein IPL31_17525 [Saprospiraceae bacterium]|nr:hypothetical protein [Saprospiraceae bacterium]
MFIKEFKIRQHTPLIHFQYTQTEAGLRNTTVKPLFDQYLKQNYKEHFSRYEKDIPFDLWIDDCNTHKDDITNSNAPLFFGNQNKSQEEKSGFIYSTGDIKITIRYRNKLLFDGFNLDKVLTDFFATRNFGTRSNKGYGCYYTLDKNGNEIYTPSNYRFEFIIPNCDIKFCTNLTMQVINYYYKLLRSGINYSKNGNSSRTSKSEYPCDSIEENLLYKKSSILLYLCENNLSRWEKPWLKKTFFDLPIAEDNFKFWRAYLGLNSIFEFGLSKNGTTNGQILGKIKVKLKVEHKEGKIKRIPSPIIFKPFLEYDVKNEECYVKVNIFVDPNYETWANEINNNDNKFVISSSLSYTNQFYQNGKKVISNTSNISKISQINAALSTLNNIDIQSFTNEVKQEISSKIDNEKNALEYIKDNMNTFFEPKEIEIPTAKLEIEKLIKFHHGSLGNSFIPIAYKGNEIVGPVNLFS